MASPERPIQEQKAELIAELNASRRDMAAELNDMAHALDFPNQIRQSFRGHKWQWLTGALVAGAITGFILMPGRQKKSKSGGGAKPEKNYSALIGILGFAAKTAFALAKPSLKDLALGELEKWTKGTFSENLDEQ